LSGTAGSGFCRLALVGIVVVVAACRPPVVSKPLPSAVVTREYEVLDPKFIQKRVGDLYDEVPGDPKSTEAYRVGPGDGLLVAVYNHPELSLAQYIGMNVASGQNARPLGLVVDNDGTTQFPLIGTVPVAGKSLNELRVFLEHELGRYIKEPKVTVQITFPGSIRYYFVGQFTQPGVKYSDRPLRLLEAIALGGGIMLDKASLRGAYLARGRKRLPVNFRRLLHEGDMSQNVVLRTGDVILVPDNSSDQAYVFAGVTMGASRVSPVPFLHGRLSIIQALAHAGFAFEDRALGKLGRVRVIRGEGDRGEIFTVNVAGILKGKAAPFQLIPGDVVYVPTRGIAKFNLALDQLTAPAAAVSQALNPYVQLKFLTE
jgi:polysaccharide biosynthesis/export protein